MNVLYVLILVLLINGYVKFFKNKLIVLLLLEAMMMSIIFMHSKDSILNSSSYLFFLMMTLIMVLDSVFSISVLIFSTRNSTKTNSMLAYI